MLSPDLFIITPFQRDQIVLTENCQEEPTVQNSEYSLLVLQTRLQPYFKRFFSSGKYNYDFFGLRDIPVQGKMISTILLFDSDQNPISLQAQENRTINAEIGQILMLHPTYFLFYSASMSNYPQAWLRTVLPVLQFTRTTYLLDETVTQEVSTITHDGNLYMDLSQDHFYLQTMSKLYTEFLETLDHYYHNGTIPQSELKSLQVKGDFIEFKGILGDQVLEDMADLSPVVFPVTDDRLQPEKRVEIPNNQVSRFILNFSEKNYEFDIFLDQVGVEFLVSLKGFFDADEVITKQLTPSYYEIVVKKRDAMIQSSLDIKQMFGYFYFTDHPLGLFVLDEMGLLHVSKVIYDDIFGKGGIFVPMVYLEDAVVKDVLFQDLENKKSWVDVFTFSDEILSHLKIFGLNVLGQIDEYLFVERNAYFTKRVIYRSLKEDHPNMLVKGPWDFEQMNPNLVLDIARQVSKEFNFQIEPELGPFSSLIIEGISVRNNSEWFDRVKEILEIKMQRPRQF